MVGDHDADLALDAFCVFRAIDHDGFDRLAAIPFCCDCRRLVFPARHPALPLYSRVGGLGIHAFFALSGRI